MGRPLFSTLIAPPEPTVRVAEAQTPTYERWSYHNPFDPDSDAFFEHCVYEAFLTPEEVAARDRESPTSIANSENAPQMLQVASGRVRAVTGGLTHIPTGLVTASSLDGALGEQPELIQASADDSSSEATASARASPIPDDIASDLRRVEIEIMESNPTDLTTEVIGVPVGHSHSISLPSSPMAVGHLSLVDFDENIPGPGLESEAVDAYVPAPLSPVTLTGIQHGHSPVNISPMTPPPSVTPRFIRWSRPRAIDMSPSPTPDAPFGSVRASRMAVSYIAPLSTSPPVAVHQ